ncbi:MAG: caspase family protein [Planctomycetia bacterium]|nr:caspase family protein [Planctomycetia bacterium]
MSENLHGPPHRPALEELSGPLRRAVEATRAEPVGPDEVSRTVLRLAGSVPPEAGKGKANGAGTFRENERLKNGAVRPQDASTLPSQAIDPGDWNMTLISNQVVQATCPGCKNSLRIPGSWIGQSMKCKHCAMVFQAKAPDKDKSADKPKKKRKKRDLLARAARATKLVLSKAIPRRKKRRKKPDVPQSKPYAPPAAIPVGTNPGTPLPAALPAAIPVGGKALPAAIPVAAPAPAAQLASLPYDSPRRRSRGWQKMVFIVIFFMAMGGMASLIYSVASNPEVQMGGHFNAITATPSSEYQSANGSTVVKDVARPTIPRPTEAVQPPAIPRGTGVPVVNPNPTPRPPLPRSTDKSAIPRGPTLPNTGTGINPGTGFNPNPGTGVNPSVPVAIDPSRSGFPRRLMAVVPVNYAFNTPIGAGGNGPRSINNVVHQMADLLRVPTEQTILLSDRAPNPKPPIKSVIEVNVQKFLQSCREHDRAVLMFVGHGVEVGDKPYLVPLEGDKENADSLIPLEWVFQQLEKCKARQKILVMDVCRSDPARGEQLGAVAPMGEKFDALLAKPPAGVQVLTSCVAGQYSYEVDAKGTPDGEFEGGVMLAQLPQIKQKGGLRGIIQRPEDPIPIDALQATLTARVGAMARVFLKAEQTVRLTGTETESKLVFDPKAKAPPAFEIELTGVFKEGVATRNDIEGLLRDIVGLPPVRRGDAGNQLNFDSMPPYPLKNLAAYKDDGKAGSPLLREKVSEAIALLKSNEINTNLQDVFIKNFQNGNQQQENAFKNQIANIQMGTGLVIFKLDSMLEELDALKADRAKETKRWQAYYDYIRARLSAKIAHVYEYNAKLGEMRKEFPEMDPNIHKGWQLAAKEKISDRDADKYGKRAKEYLTTLAAENAGTPWELIGKREKVTALGMDWKPSPK